MFGKNVYMFPHGSSSSHPRASLLGLNGTDIFFHHHEMLPGHCSPADAAAFCNHDVHGLNGDPSSTVADPSQFAAKASKKDRHSKIHTAQGPRDRRVRLSIGVARKFFDLQEILGFDKPSKTLDWLLNKSKTAIKDLVLMREKLGSTDAAKSGSSAPSECEVDSEKGKSVLPNSQPAAKDPTPASNHAKESRMKARARARERTREKMSIKKLNEAITYGCSGGGGGYDVSPIIPIQFMNNQLEFRKISGSSGNINLGMLHCHEAANDQDLIQESIVIKRKVKHPSILGFQQNLIISSSNYGVPSPYNSAISAENWDISSCISSSQSNVCAILDQHKFINGASNN